MKLGFPPRPTTGSAPSLTARDIATPKLNGMRVLMDRNGNVYNRKMQPFTKMDRETRHEIHDKLLTNSCKYVQWWDMEYVHKDRVAAIIDCCDGSDADYHSAKRAIRFRSIDEPTRTTRYNICTSYIRYLRQSEATHVQEPTGCSSQL